MTRLPLTAAALLCALACRRKDTLDHADSSFVATMVELRKLDRGVPTDSLARAEVLRRRGFTRDSLERVSRALAEDPERAALVYSEIDRRAGGTSPVTPQAPPPARPR